LEGKDFATDTKAEAIRLLLASLDGKDFASETTLAALGTELELLKAELETIKANQTSGDQKVQLSGNILEGKDFATDTKAEAIRLLLASLDGKDFASETTLAALGTELELLKAELETIKANQTSGDQKVQLSGKIAEKASAQHSESATTVKTYTRAAGAARIEVYVESGRVRIRTDGQPCTAVTGEPLGEGFGAAWTAASISVLYVDDGVITVVSR